MPGTGFAADRQHAAALDAGDELSCFRRRFAMPRAGSRTLNYLCGHSLGLMPKRAPAKIARELERWRKYAVEGHFGGNSGWLGFHERFAKPLASLAGARESEIVAMNSLTVNLHLMLVSFFEPTPQRSAILIEAGAFPSDRYAIASQLKFHGLDPAVSLLELKPSSDWSGLDAAELEEVLRSRGDSIALILLPGVQYLTGEALDLGALTAVAQRYGCRIGFDLAHAIGNVPLSLHEANADFAVWCSYKYLNGGPGAIGGCFVHERHAQNDELPRFAGWWGHDKSRRFLMEPRFSAIPGAQGWQLSNPPIFSMAPLEASLEIFDAARLARLRRKSVRLTNYLEFLLRNSLGDSLSILTPGSAQRRGAQLSVRLDHARLDAARVARGLRAQGFVVDVREPDILRITPVPLYNRFRDVYELVSALERLLR